MSLTKKNEKIGFIGLGRMGRCLVQGLLGSNSVSKEQILFTTKHKESTQRVIQELKIKAADSNQDLVNRCDIIVLAVKPQNIKEVLNEIKDSVRPDQTYVSIVASVPTHQIEVGLSEQFSVVRAMPNTPAFVREAITPLCPGKWATAKDLKRAESIFRPLGHVVHTDEKYMNAITGLSGCGPAYVYLILEALTEAGIKVGLPRDLATQLCAQTLLGSAKMLLETGKHPAALKDEVTTPAGCTIEGIVELEEGKLRVTLIKAVVKATERAEQLSKLSQS